MSGACSSASVTRKKSTTDSELSTEVLRIVGVENKTFSVQFEGSVGEDGKIPVPPEFLERLQDSALAKIHVRLTANRLHGALKQRQVSEEEIEAIGKLQLESRDQVVRFLLSEGSLSRRTNRRSRKGRGRKEPAR